MTHVWLIKLRTREVKKVLLNAGGIEVKGRFCAVIDPVQQEITLKVHWVPFHVTGEALKKAFDHYVEEKEVQDEWKVRGFEQSESTTRIVRMTLREDLTPDALPHLFRIFGGSVLVVVPGRAPICLRCRRKGHIRRDCRVPRCAQCREFGHEIKDCVRTYARVTGSRQHEEEGLELMEGEVNDKGEVRTESAPERLDQECDVMKEVMDAESETPYETPDETVTEEPATPAKRSRSDETDETLEGSVQRLEPHWMVVRSTRAKKGKHVPAQRSASLTREGQAAMQ
ncbi:hypothetical protein HPB50_011300 [Hyalomma asiaticum]|uniref:Uncharacterized protein n=1 Tax=Hyalomma asiaticum TaxID=266040 RepID=A0ACB7SPJ4_HYAAI|nr:hypothetical protein HPB50_011300 [Hyalomma asiaticum]